MVDIQFIGLLNATLQAATLLFIAALGELITEKSGILNLGVEGMISIGAVSGFIAAINTGSLFFAIIIGVLSASAFASIHAFVTVVLKQDQTVSGLILTILGLSLSSLIGKKYVGKKLDVKLESVVNIAEPDSILDIFLSQNIIFYVSESRSNYGLLYASVLGTIYSCECITVANDSNCVFCWSNGC